MINKLYTFSLRNGVLIMENMDAELQTDPTLYLKVSDWTVENFLDNGDDDDDDEMFLCFLFFDIDATNVFFQDLLVQHTFW